MTPLYKIVLQNDKKIYDLAVYYETKGYTKGAPYKQVVKRFIEFKTRIFKGSITLKQLEKDVLKQYGIWDKDAIEQINKIDKDKNKEVPSELSKKTQELLEKLSIPVEDSKWE